MSVSDIQLNQMLINSLKAKVDVWISIIRDPEALYDLVGNTTELSQAMRDLGNSARLRYEQNQLHRNGGDDGHKSRASMEDRFLTMLEEASKLKTEESLEKAKARAAERVNEIPAGEFRDLDKHFPFTPSEMKAHEIALKAQRQKLRATKDRK